MTTAANNVRTRQPKTTVKREPTDANQPGEGLDKLLPKGHVLHVIAPNAVYTTEAVKMALALKNGTLPREIREGRLRVAKRAGKYFFKGQWLLDWIAAGEVVRKHRWTTPAASAET